MLSIPVVISQAGPLTDNVISALIGAGAALGITVLAPVVNSYFERRRTRQVRREELIGQLRGLRQAIPQVAFMGASARVNFVLALVQVPHSKSDWGRDFLVQEMRDHLRDGNAQIQELTRLERELHESLARVRILFKMTSEIEEALGWFDSPRYIALPMDDMPASGAVADRAHVEAWVKNRTESLNKASDETYRIPLGRLISLLEKN